MILLALWFACVPEPEATPPDDTEDSIGLVDTPDVDTDRLPDTDVATGPACAADEPEGFCPGVAACVAGRCLVPEGSPAPAPADAVDQWRTIAAYTRTRWPLGDTRGVDLAAWEEDGAAAVAAATTEGEVAWAMVTAMDRLIDGHTGLTSAPLCQVGPSLGDRSSNVGACVAEGEDGLIVLQLAPNSPFVLGDVLLAIDGRPAEALIADRLAQPRCRLHASSEAGFRATAVRSLMRRPPGERFATVRRAGAEVQVPLRYGGQPVPCRTHLGPANAAPLVADTTWAPLPGDGVYVHIPQMGASTEDGGFSFEPIVDALRELLQDRTPSGPLLVDLRGNPGGHTDVARTLADWMVPEGTPLWQCSQRVGDGVDDVTQTQVSRARPSAFRWDGPLAVLVDGATYGSSEFLPGWVEETGRGLVVGAPTNGAFGMTWPIPGTSWGAYINALRCERLDGTPLDGFPDPVDVPSRLRAADVAAGVDTVVQAALDALAE